MFISECRRYSFLRQDTTFSHATWQWRKLLCRKIYYYYYHYHNYHFWLTCVVSFTYYKVIECLFTKYFFCCPNFCTMKTYNFLFFEILQNLVSRNVNGMEWFWLRSSSRKCHVLVSMCELKEFSLVFSLWGITTKRVPFKK